MRFLYAGTDFNYFLQDTLKKTRNFISLLLQKIGCDLGYLYKS